MTGLASLLVPRLISRLVWGLTLASTPWFAMAQTQAESTEDDNTWTTSANLEAWVYGTRNTLADDAVLNPGNRIARLSHSTAWFDGRLNLRAENGPMQLLATPRLTEQQNQMTRSGVGDAFTRTGAGRLGQGFVRYKAADTALTLGRELFVWGPGNFRSPSSPFYFDAGRTNPLAATPGIDLVRATQALGSVRVTAAHVFATTQLQPAQDQAHTSLLKIDQQGSSHLVSLIVSQQRGARPFAGAFAQFTPDDAWLLYGEMGSSRQPYAMTPNEPGTPGPFYRFEQPAPRTVNALLGASYTLENGHTLVAEYLHNTGGYRPDQLSNYFAQARHAAALAQTQPAVGYPALGQALGAAPRLLGRDYVWLNWQSNPQEPGLYWRAGWTQNITDRSGQATVYLEKNFVPKLSGFVVITVNRGSAQTEYGMLWRSSVTAGVKWFVF
ncbi:MAG: hypothetical protein IPJ18_01630 [Betaproteobacteria bacterium]|nr:hypothetical protein [Betaproteobacteria bacterium]